MVGTTWPTVGVTNILAPISECARMGGGPPWATMGAIFYLYINTQGTNGAI